MNDIDTRKDKTALILEGGAMRGMFTCGVLDVFMEKGITFKAACGISAGAVFGCNLKSRQIGRAIRYNKRYAGDPRYCSLRSLVRTGDLYGVSFCYRKLPSKLDAFDTKTFSEDPMDFYVGATDLETGKTVFHLCRDGGRKDLLWMRASASMPVVSRPVETDGYKLLDGGITCAVPYRFMEEQGYLKNVIILTQPEDYRKKKSAAMPLMRMALHKYPAVVKAMDKRHEMYNSQMKEIKKREDAGFAFVIRPDQPLGIHRTESDPKELERIYRLGREKAEQCFPKLLEFLLIKSENDEICDLHTHSSFSDGSSTPEELVELAEKEGIRAIALTDHNTIKGLGRFMAAGKKSRVKTAAGCEFSTDYTYGTGSKAEIHIAGLFLPEESWDDVEKYVEKLKAAKKESNIRLIKDLRDAGYDITYGQAASLTDADEFNRAHVSRLLINKGYVKDRKEAFETILSEKRGYYHPPKRPDVFETIAFIKKAGGIAVMAHPFLNLRREELHVFLPEAKKAGLDAIETRYPDFDEEMIREAEMTAKKYGLFQSGGSDYHGRAKPDIFLGKGYGSLHVPFSFYEILEILSTLV